MAKGHRPWLRVEDFGETVKYTIIGNGINHKIPRDAIIVPKEYSRATHIQALGVMLNKHWPDRWTEERITADIRKAEENHEPG